MLQAAENGDFSVRLPGDWTGLEGKIADTVNGIVAANAKMATELQRVATAPALQEADRRKDEFLAMLAHELRNPLAPIQAAVQLLRLKELGESQRSRARDIIDRQVEHLVRLIDDLLDVSRISHGIITLHREPVLIGAIVARAIETSRPAIDARGHELLVQLPDELLSVDGDQTRLVQVVSNMLQNAAKFTDSGGRIVLRVTCHAPFAIISVKDTGVGIPAESMPRLFELFARFHAQHESGRSGLGIGLALVRRLVEMHGGSVTARSDGPGHGAEFTVRLPLLTVQPSPAPDHSNMPETTVHDELRRILIADDNHDAAEALGTLLTLRGHDVRTAHDGVEALAAAEAFKPHVLLLDLGMPKMDGYETVRQARRQAWGKQAIIVALTGWGQQQDRQRTAEAGFDAHLVKPVTDVQLIQTLTAIRATRDRAATT